MNPASIAAGMVAPIIAAIVLRARRRLVERLEQAGATRAETAIALEPKRRLERKAIGHLRRKGVIVEPQPGRYFVVPDRASAWRKSVRTRVAVALVAVAAATAVVLAVNA